MIALFSFAAIGLVKMLQENPGQIIFSIAMAIGIIYLINRFMNSPQRSPGYHKALRKQKKKEKLSHFEMQKLNKLKKTSRGDIPFRVIDGRKGKTPKNKDDEDQPHTYH
jgi:hypothetical protein